MSDTAHNPTRVLIVDDHAIFRAGLKAELEKGVEVVGEAAGVTEAVLLIGKLKPDVILLDVHMPDGGGVGVIRRTTELETVDGYSPCFLALSVSDAPEDVVQVVRAGARGYVTKMISGPDLIEAIERVRQGDAVFSPKLAGFVLDAFAKGPGSGPVDPELDLLTPREQEVLRLIARGYLYKEIALRLKISVKTVESHVSAVLRKLQLSTRHELSRWAAERNLVDYD